METPVNSSFNNPRSKPLSRNSSKGNESEEEISSPAVKNLKIARVPLNRESMKSSTKIYLQESAKHLDGGSVVENKSEGETSYKIKMLIFLILSLFVTIHVMSPNRKISYRRKWLLPLSSYWFTYHITRICILFKSNFRFESELLLKYIKVFYITDKYYISWFYHFNFNISIIETIAQ